MNQSIKPSLAEFVAQILDKPMAPWQREVLEFIEKHPDAKLAIPQRGRFRVSEKDIQAAFGEL